MAKDKEEIVMPKEYLAITGGSLADLTIGTKYRLTFWSCDGCSQICFTARLIEVEPYIFDNGATVVNAAMVDYEEVQ